MFKLKKNKAVLGAIVLLALCFMSTEQINAYSQDRPVLRGAATTNIRLEGESPFANSTQPITVSLRDSDVKQAIRMFADKAGLNVIFHDSVKGKITLDLVDVPLGDAIRMIAQMAELTYMVESNTVMVLPNDVAKKLDVSKNQMSVIPLKYIDAGSAAEFLNANIFKKSRPGLSNSNVATANTIKNELILFGQDEDFKLAQKVLTKIDVKPHISTYKVNHTTPKEMAKMLCESLFGQDNSASGEKMSAAWSEDLQLGGAYKACTVKSAAKQETSADSINDGKLMGIAGPSLTISYMPGGGNIQVVGGSPEQIQLISDFISHNDRKQPQAYIEMSIVELNENGSKEFSSTWNIYSNFFTGSVGGDGLKTTENYPIFWKSGGGLGEEIPVKTITNLDGTTTTIYSPKYTQGSYPGVGGIVIEDPMSASQAAANFNSYLNQLDNYVHNTLYAYNHKEGATMDEFPQAPTYTPSTVTVQSAAFRYNQPTAITQQLNFVVKNGKGRVLSNPKIVVTNGKKSTIDLTSDIVESVTSQFMDTTTYTTGITRKTYNIGSGKNGIKIELVPFISPDGYVSMNIKPKYSSIAETIYATGETGQPELQATLLRNRNLELSNVRVKDGETLALGGLVQEYETKSVSKTPILGDLPIIGFLFRNSATSNQKSELVILITPRIIKDNEDVVGSNL